MDTTDSITGEVWAPVPGYAGYLVSDHGRLMRLGYTNTAGNVVTPRVLSLYENAYGYLKCGLNGRQHYVHRVVAAAFLGPRQQDHVVRHLDGNPANNHVGNLAYGTQAENMADNIVNGTNHSAAKSHCKRGHELAGGNLRTQARGRMCRACATATDALRRDGYRATDVGYEERLQAEADERYAKYMAGGSLSNAAKSHCKRGHELAGGNLMVDSRGSRHCLACKHTRSKLGRDGYRATDVGYEERLQAEADERYAKYMA